MRRLCWAILALIGLCAEAQSQSWCGEAKTPVEKTICANAALGRSDSQLIGLYNSVKATASDPQSIVNEQRSFLKRRQACGPDAGCLAHEYDRQIQLYGGTPSAGAQSRSWCDTAETLVEKTICGDAALVQKDAQLAELYAHAKAGPSDTRSIVNAQRAFLKRRQVCGSDAGCLAQEYDKQIRFYDGTPVSIDTAGVERAGSQAPIISGSEIKISRVDLDYGDIGGAGNDMDALVIDNSDYVELQKLKTPKADAALVATALRSKGIATKVVSDIQRADMISQIESFSGSPRKGVFVFYYAGHAANIGGNSSIIFPTFRVAGGNSNGEYEPISAITAAIAKLGYKKALIVFDACRNIVDIDAPSSTAETTVVTSENTRSVKVLGSRTIELAALAGMDYAISFSSAEGQTALDTVNGVNSPFAEAFAANIRDKNTFFDAIVETRRTVRRLTDDKQRPTLEMSWDEDSSLTTKLIKSVSYTFLEPAPAIVGRPSPEIRPDVRQFADPGSFTLNHKATAGDGCKTEYGIAGSAMFTPASFECLVSFYGLSVRQNRTTGTKFDFPMYATRERDSSLGNCEEAKFTLDLDADGRPETASFGSNKYGGYLQFERDGHVATYYSQLGCSFSQITAYDVDHNGVADLIIEYACGEDERCLVVLSGERLVANVDGDVESQDESYLEKYLDKSKYLGILYGLLPVALFYDQHIKYIKQLSPSGLSYTCYGGSWDASVADGVMPDKQVSINRDGSVVLVSNGHRLAISKIQDRNIEVIPMN